MVFAVRMEEIIVQISLFQVLQDIIRELELLAVIRIKHRTGLLQVASKWTAVYLHDIAKDIKH